MGTKIKRQKFFFSAGCVALTCALLSVTFFPLVINNYMPHVFVSINDYKFYTFSFYILTLILFLLSSKYHKFQIKWIFITFAYYGVFQVLAKIIL